MLEINDIILAVLYVLPAYVANGSPVIIYKILHGRTTPIDMGIIMKDGKRVLGDGKSVEGFIGGTIIGFITGFIINTLIILYRNPLEYFLLSIGTMIGDLMGSFIKRRLGLERGAPAPIMDQLGFIIVALLFVWAIMGLPQWININIIIIIFIITFILHITTNLLAYLIGIKNKPW